MPPLQIDFEDGFDGDAVRVSAGGRELWRSESVTTNLPSSLAEIVHVEVPDRAPVEVAVPSRGLAASQRVEAPYLRVNIDPDGRLVLEPRTELPLHG